jgi:hypothetical protein
MAQGHISLSDVPPSHLMRPVHSAGRRRPVHSAGRRRPVHSIGRQYAHAAACTILIITRALPRKQSQHINTAWTTNIMAPGDCSGVLALVTSIMYSLRFSPGPTCRGSASLHMPPLSYKREGTRRYKADSHRLSDSQALKFTQTQYNTQWSRVLRSGDLNHSKSSCSLVFIDHLADRQNA